ncbi:MAG TPA: hypothetical protein DHU96_28110 [Actinobacteria bacterium]|nr:hypothetical protein [Actinomycetota bacterium]
MSSVDNAGGQSNKRMIALVLGIIGALAIIVGIVYLAVPAGSLPAFMGATKPASGHHTVRMATALVVGIVCLAAGWYVNKGSKAAADAGSSAPAEVSK